MQIMRQIVNSCGMGNSSELSLLLPLTSNNTMMRFAKSMWRLWLYKFIVELIRLDHIAQDETQPASTLLKK